MFTPIYQHTAKETVARHFGVSLYIVDAPYSEWREWRGRYERATGRTPEGAALQRPFPMFGIVGFDL